MSLIGTATALGQVLVIPIILRSLAGTVAFVENKKIPFTPDAGFLASLDCGEHHIVKNFELRWWSGRKPRDLNTVEILNASTLKKCLDHYRDQKSNQLSNTTFPTGAGAGLHATDRADAGPKPTLFADAIPVATHADAEPSKTYAAAGPSKTPAAADAEIAVGCQSCIKYRQLLSDVLQDVLKFQDFASGMSTSSENLFNIGIRRASTFNLLHEAAIAKESADVPLPAPAPASHHIAEVIRNASSELERLKGLPASSYKWTWGETLTEGEVLKLRRPGTRPGRQPHSGYDITLPDGRPAGEYSDNPSTISSTTGQHDDLPAEATDQIPTTELHFPRYFSHPEHRRIYDPFTISNSSITPNAQINHPASAQMNPSGISIGNGLLDLANLWTSSSESGNIPSVGVTPNEKEMDVFDLADAWNDNVQTPPTPTSHEVPAPMPVNNIQTDPGNSASEVINVLDLANLWDKGNEDAGTCQSGTAADEGSVQMPVNTIQIAPVDPESEVIDVLDVADLWEKDNEVAGPSDSGQLDNEDIAALWIDDEADHDHSGDELVSPSYLDPPSGALDVADQWIESEDPVTGVDRTHLDWSYGPEHFSFLRDDMFDSDVE